MRRRLQLHISLLPIYLQHLLQSDAVTNA